MWPPETLLSALAATLGIAGSPAEAADPSPGTPDELEAVVGDGFQSQVAWKGDLAGMRQRRYIRVLVPHNRTYFFYDGLQPHGLAYEAMTEFGNTLNAGKKTTDRIFMMFLPTSRDRLITDVANGYGDIAMAGLTVTAAREKDVDFIPYSVTMNEIVVTGPGAPWLDSVEDLSGQTVFVRRSSSYFESLTALNARLKAAGKPPVKIKLADEQLETEDILELMNAGVVSITLCDAYLAKLWAQALPNIRPRVDLVTRADAHLGPVVRKGSPELKAAFAAFLKTHGPGTTFGNVVIQRYARDNPWVLNPGTTEDLRRFQEALPFFQKYAKQYDFDHLLIAAQAYQESRINQKLKSSAGAVGVMQIKPATAADPNVGIPDVQKMDANIHAGVKYLRFVCDRYFPDAKFDELNRHVFAFAAYNAGPGRIQQLRTRAEKQGLDPNTWFNSVEIVAGREVGREPVDYVRNILKYWVAYRLALETEDDADPPEQKKDPPERKKTATATAAR